MTIREMLEEKKRQADLIKPLSSATIIGVLTKYPDHVIRTYGPGIPVAINITENTIIMMNGLSYLDGGHEEGMFVFEENNRRM